MTANLWKSTREPFTLANAWLERCSNLHGNCRGNVQCELPTRLVAIGTLGQIKLVESTTLLTRPRYSTLSYCWGQEPFTMLAQDNLSLFQDQIPCEKLPQTFRDAIEVTQKLGLDYIWIDALCIVQSEPGCSSSDWTKEAGRMRSVYGGSFVNIAATSAMSVHEGFLDKGLRQDYHGALVARITTENSCRVQSFYSPTAHEETTFETHLASRAWAFQERVLSRRTLSFGDTGMSWECRWQTSSDFLPDGFNEWRGQQGLLPKVYPEDRPLSWTNVVMKYSRTNLTYPSDRLPALSGVASRQQAVTGGHYLAGMWRERLHEQVLWRRIVSPSTPLRARPPWRAPTWSWTSLDGGVEIASFFMDGSKQYTTLLDAWTTPAGPDPFGAVTGGELVLACSHLLQADLKVENGESKAAASALTAMGPVDVVLDCSLNTEAMEENNNLVFLLPIVYRRGSASSYVPHPQNGGRLPVSHIRGLVLRPEKNKSSSKGRFTRVGYFELKGHYLLGTMPRFGGFMEGLERTGKLTARAECIRTISVSRAKQDDDHLCVIVIE